MLKIFILFFDYLSRLRKVEEVSSYEIFYVSFKKIRVLLYLLFSVAISVVTVLSFAIDLNREENHWQILKLKFGFPAPFSPKFKWKLFNFAFLTFYCSFKVNFLRSGEKKQPPCFLKINHSFTFLSIKILWQLFKCFFRILGLIKIGVLLHLIASEFICFVRMRSRNSV